MKHRKWLEAQSNQNQNDTFKEVGRGRQASGGVEKKRIEFSEKTICSEFFSRLRHLSFKSYFSNEVSASVNTRLNKFSNSTLLFPLSRCGLRQAFYVRRC